MSESGGNPIQVAVFVLLVVGGGWYFFQHYEVDGLDEVAVNPKSSLSEDQTFISYRDSPPALSPSNDSNGLATEVSQRSINPFKLARNLSRRVEPKEFSTPPRAYGKLKIASWALDGFGPTKLNNRTCQQNVARVVRQFDVVALQQIASIERDLIPRLVDVINQGGSHYDFVIGPSTGPENRPEQLAFLFDTTRVVVDRRQTYTLEDPDNQITFDPLVAWFRAAEPSASKAWTFSLVNLRVDLARAPNEVALLPNMLKAIRDDGRGEDDIILVGLFQADDAYLLPTVGIQDFEATVASRPTDIFGRYQTSNVLLNSATTSEYVGRGGVFEYLRLYDLNLLEAETVTSHLPVYAEFTATESASLE